MSAAADSMTDSMANATIQDPPTNSADANTTTSGDKPTNASQNEAVLLSAQEGRRLYIGNLAYATSEGELREFFQGYLV